VRDDTNSELTNKSPNQNISKSLNDAANVSFIARLRVACRHFDFTILIIQNERTMKTTSHLRMFIIVTMMTAAACSEQEIVPTTKGSVTSSNQSSTHEYHTSLTTWSRADVGSTFVGLVSSVPDFDLSKATIFVVGNGKTNTIDTFLDVTRLQMAHSAQESYMWATTKNNILLLNYVGASLPPFPLEVVIVY
jgi:hypothetical protein